MAAAVVKPYRVTLRLFEKEPPKGLIVEESFDVSEDEVKQSKGIDPFVSGLKAKWLKDMPGLIDDDQRAAIVAHVSKNTVLHIGNRSVVVNGPVNIGTVRKLSAQELKNDPYVQSGRVAMVQGIPGVGFDMYINHMSSDTPTAFRMQNPYSGNVYSVIANYGYWGHAHNTINVDGHLFDCS